MAATTTAQFARQLRRLGATVTVRDGGYEVTAGYLGVEVISHFRPDVDGFDVAYRTDDPAAQQTEPIRSMAAVRRVLGLPTQPILTLGTTGRRNSRTHILRPGLVHHRRMRRQPAPTTHRRGATRGHLPPMPLHLAATLTRQVRTPAPASQLRRRLG